MDGGEMTMGDLMKLFAIREALADVQEKKINVLLTVIADMADVLQAIVDAGALEGCDDEFIETVESLIENGQEIVAISEEKGVLQ